MTHRFACRVYYEDTDLAGVVYYANYLRFIERARTEFVRAQGLDQTALRAQGLVFVVTRIEADYLKPARFEDDLTVLSTPLQSTGVRLILGQDVLRGDDLLFRSRVTLACMSPDGRPLRLPAPLASTVPNAERAANSPPAATCCSFTTQATKVSSPRGTACNLLNGTT